MQSLFKVFSGGDACRDGGMGLALLQAQAVEEPLELASANDYALLPWLFWPLEATAHQSSVVEPEAIVVPGEDLDFVASSVAEDEEAACEEILLVNMGDDGGETVDRFAHIGSSAGEVNASGVVSAQHEGVASAPTTARRS